MRAKKICLIAVLSSFLGCTATISVAQPTQDDYADREVGAGATLVVTSISGPKKAIHDQTISVTYSVENKGAAASGAYKVGLYLSTDKKIDPAEDRLLDKVTFSTGLAPGQSRKKTALVLVPINGLSGEYYYGAIVASSKKASAKQVSLVRYSLADDNSTVTDHKTGLVWQQSDDGVQREWAAAGQYCADLSLAGKADWRLPSINELQTVIDYSRHNPTINPIFDCHNLGISLMYWSGKSVADKPEAAWLVDFNTGTVFSYNKTGYYGYARCVRGRL